MKKSRVFISWGLALLYIISMLLIGFKVKYANVAAIGFMLLFAVSVIKFFPCPGCGKALSLYLASRAMFKEMHCPHCGESIRTE